VWDRLHPTQAQQRELHHWLRAHGDGVLTGDSFFHLSALGDRLPGLNLCGAGRVVCLIDPVGDVYACPFAIHDSLLAGNVRSEGGFTRVWRESRLFRRLRVPNGGGGCRSCAHVDSCRGGCMAAKLFTGLPLDGPDPECVLGHGEALLRRREQPPRPMPSRDHSRPRLPRLPARLLPVVSAARPRPCDDDPVSEVAVALADEPAPEPAA
jgi:mycofactocin radical SAM maturase